MSNNMYNPKRGKVNNLAEAQNNPRAKFKGEV